MTSFILVQLPDYNRILINSDEIKTIEETDTGCMIQLIDDEEIESITEFVEVLRALSHKTIRLSDN